MIALAERRCANLPQVEFVECDVTNLLFDDESADVVTCIQVLLYVADVENALEDPEYLAEPITSTVVWHHTPHLEMLRVDCDPDVARQFLQ